MVDVHPNSPLTRGGYDAPNMSTSTPAEDARAILLNRVSWSAVLAGVVVALVTHLILNLIGIGIGASTLDPTASAAENPTASGFSIGAGMWWAVAGILASLAGGYAAGRLAGRPDESTAAWHGLTAWAFTTLLIFYLLTSTVGGIIGGAYRTVANAAGNIANTAGSAAQTAVMQAADPFASIERGVRDVTGGSDPAAMRDTAVAAIRAAFTGDQNQAQQARDRAVQALAQAQNIPVEQARTQVEQYEQQYRQAAETTRRQAAEAADVAASAIATGALFGAIALVLGAIAAWFGGRMGAIERTWTRPFTRERQA